MFILDFLVPLGLTLLEKAIFGYSKAVKAIARPRMGEIQNLQFATGNFCFFRLQTSIMVYKITSVMILRSSFINNHFKSKKELGGLKILTIGKNIYNTSKSYQNSKNKSLYCLFQYLFIFESPKLLFGLKIVVCEAAPQNHIQGNFINHY